MHNQHNYTQKNLGRIKSQINPFMKWLVDEEIIQKNPLQGIRFRQNIDSKRARVILSQDEIQMLLCRLMEFSPEFLFPFVYFIIHTGCRRGEAQKLTWEDVDLETKLVRFRHTKNGTSRQVKMSRRLFEFLRNYPQKSANVFTDEKGKAISRGKLQRRLKSFKKMDHFEKDWRYHDLRHSFAYNFLKRGGEMYQLKAILGHKSIQMTVDLYGNLKAVDVENPSPFDF